MPESQLAEHAAHECLMRLVACPLCGGQFIACAIKEHVVPCGDTPSRCELCHSTVTLRQLRSGSHEPVCKPLCKKVWSMASERSRGLVALCQPGSSSAYSIGMLCTSVSETGAGIRDDAAFSIRV